jgi:uncharacterized membrane protein YphA (DoxX/SURF4 family)
MKTSTTIISWILRIIAALIMLQTLYFKFTGAEESVYIFTTLGLEPVGRIGSGIAELVASILLLIPSRAWLGALLSIGIMGGAIMSHLTVLGIEIRGDGGLLFSYSLIVMLCSVGVLWIHREQPLALINGLTGKKV